MATILAFAASAQAGLTITVTEAGVAGSASSSTAGNSLVFIGSFGDYTFVLSTAVTNSPGSGDLATLNVSSSETRAGSALPGSSGVLSISIDATGFTNPDPSTPLLFAQSIGSNSSSSLAVMTFQSSINGSPLPLQGPLAHGTSDVFFTPIIGGIGASPFSMSNTTTISVDLGQGGSTSGSTEISTSLNFTPAPVPEPTSIIVWSSLIACTLGANGWRRRHLPI